MGKAMKFDSEDTFFWQTEGINHTRFYHHNEWYEGEDTVEKIAEIVGFDCTIRDVGSGYGRLASFFKPENYIGYDICQAVVRKASRLRPNYKIVHWDFSEMTYADVTLFVNGPHLVNNDEILPLVELMCKDTKAVVFGEMMDPAWIGPFEFKEYRREVTTYDEMFSKYNFKRVRTEITNHAYWNKPFTIARWESELCG